MNQYGIMTAFQSWYGALIMGVLIAMSVYLGALIIVRLAFYRKARVNSQKLVYDAQQALNSNDAKLLNDLKSERPSDPPLRILVGLGLANAHLTAPELAELFSVTRVRQRDRLTRGLGTCGTFAAIAPFLGLLGTVMGIVSCFEKLAQSGAAGPNVVAAGVAEALWATAAGLFVAIPSVVAYNVFKHKVKMIMTDMEVVSRELILLLKGDKKHSLKLSPKEA